MDCLDAKQMLEPCASGQLSATDRVDLDRHVATCEGCRLELELTRAVLGSSSSQESADDPALVDPVMMEAESDPASFDTVEEPTIEQERRPQIAPEGPVPPRVLTSQLPEESEEDLDLARIQQSSYDPGAIHLPRPDQTFEPSAAGESESEGSIPEVAASFGGLSFDDLAMDSATLPIPPPAASGAHDTLESGATGKAGSAKWDFEPVDLPRASAPPEESLTFAKEALDRQRGNASRGKQQARLLLWIGGAVGGVGLLGASVWMALAFREPAGSMEPSNVPALQPPPGSAPIPPSSSDSLAPSTEPTPGVTATDSSAAPQPSTSVIRAGATAGATGTGAIIPPAANPKPSGSKQAPHKTTEGARPGTSTGATPTSTKPVANESGKPSASPAPATAAFRDDELAPAPRREPKILTVEPDAKPGDASYTEEDEKPVTEPPPKPVITAPIFVPPSAGTSSASGSRGTESGTGPIDRLHTLTATAEKNQDLEGLRTIKTTWKSMIRSSAGQERSRSKREYADCLWAIQGITKRDADRKEALAAYREYVLHAPAGGADARTVSRMRHLEDILSDAQ
jgi:hypothetical protein